MKGYPMLSSHITNKEVNEIKYIVSNRIFDYMHVIRLYGNYLVNIMFHISAQQYNTFRTWGRIMEMTLYWMLLMRLIKGFWIFRLALVQQLVLLWMWYENWECGYYYLLTVFLWGGYPGFKSAWLAYQDLWHSG